MREYKGFKIPSIHEISETNDMPIVPNLVLESKKGTRLNVPITFEDLYKLSAEKSSAEVDEYIYNECCKTIDEFGGE